MIDADPAYHFDADPDPASWYLAEMWIRIQSDPGLIDQVSRCLHIVLLGQFMITNLFKH
jgi:hypothetical protein